MGLIIGLMTVLMVLDCVVLILLVLMQLPKKDAGAGLAFGGAATDALFGAGSGNFLTKATKYAAVIFFSFALLLSILENVRAHSPGSDFRRQLERQQNQVGATAPSPQGAPAAAPASSGTSAPGSFSLAVPTNAAASKK